MYDSDVIETARVMLEPQPHIMAKHASITDTDGDWSSVMDFHKNP